MWLSRPSWIVQTCDSCQELSMPGAGSFSLDNFVSFCWEAYLSSCRAVISTTTSQELSDSSSHDDSRRVGLLCEWQKGKRELTFGLEILLSGKEHVSSLLPGHFDFFLLSSYPLKGIAVVW